MRTSTRVLGFLAVLVLVLGLGWAGGRWLGPDEETVAADEGGHGSHGSSQTAEEASDAHGSHGSGAEAAAAGLQVSEHGHTLTLAEATLPAGRQELAFTVEGEDGPVTAYDVAHEKQLHLIVVRRDLTGFQHVHPTMDADGTWRVDVDLEPGPWRVFADFKPTDGEAHVLGADLFVPGDFQPEPLGEQELSASVDGYDVNLGGGFVAGEESTLTATVSRDGEVVDLEPYLGATGHLVALRAGDLGYLHVHPEEDTDRAEFHTSFPSVGTYRLFLDFQHDGVVRTAAFTVEVEGAGHDHATHSHGEAEHEDEQEDDHEH
ncbi:hypothetical protein QWY28_16085 [Nocardioides sp. SOB77]|uniref:DUF748 domain-containing protein n=1 Tax=Nocardioides oceani TaxID=3058369 RepID=A0ABT8FJ47_9ACTN|nr:hypothetical protein [Nocardioides oceani]MDN4174480.1 hypothetical protein [Nocardioides oceani]